MVSAWWLLLAFFVGGYAGVLLMALMTFVGERERERFGGHSRDHRRGVSAGPNPGSAVDWVI